jgi:hypothetical protein
MQEKLAYIQKALEMGAAIDVYFHDIKGEEEAIKTAAQFSRLSKKPYECKASNSYDWLKIYCDEDKITTAIFYEKGYMEEDINFDGGVEDVTA